MRKSGTSQRKKIHKSEKKKLLLGRCSSQSHHLTFIIWKNRGKDNKRDCLCWKSKILLQFNVPFFFLAASFSSFSGGPNICPRCNKTVYFGKPIGVFISHSLHVWVLECVKVTKAAGFHGDYLHGGMCVHVCVYVCGCVVVSVCGCVCAHSWEGVISGEELAPALSALWEMQ